MNKIPGVEGAPVRQRLDVRGAEESSDGSLLGEPALTFSAPIAGSAADSPRPLGPVACCSASGSAAAASGVCRRWPAIAKWVGTPLFALASAHTSSRVHETQHARRPVNSAFTLLASSVLRRLLGRWEAVVRTPTMSGAMTPRHDILKGCWRRIAGLAGVATSEEPRLGPLRDGRGRSGGAEERGESSWHCRTRSWSPMSR